MRHKFLLASSILTLSMSSSAFANNPNNDREETPLSLEEILAWNSEYRAQEPRLASDSESQASGPPVLSPKVPVPHLTGDGLTTKHVQASDSESPQSETSSNSEHRTEDVVVEDKKISKSELVPVLRPKERELETPINKPKGNVPTFDIGLPLLLDGRYVGELTVRVGGEIVKLPTEKLIALVKPDFTQATLEAIEASSFEGFLEIGAFTVEGLSFNYNPQLQQIEITSSSNSREVQILKFGVEDRERNQVLYEPANMSLFVSPTVSAEYNWNDEFDTGDNLSPFGVIDVGGRLGGEKGVAFLSRQRFDTRDGLDFERDETQLIYDVLPRLVRLTAGDIRPRGDNLQTVPSVLGLSVERFFELEPNRLFRPTSQTGFELERPSTVEVRINGVVQREIFLNPGRYDIRDLPLVQGSNLVDIVIRDDLGRERIISDRNFFDFGLLEEGVWDYSLTAGVRSEFNGDGGVDYTDDPIVSGFIRGGLTKELTLGADIQGDSDGVNGGVSTLWASSLGVLRLGLSGSERDNIGTGLAADAAFNATGFFGETGDTRWTATIGGRYNTEEFSVLPTSVTDSTFIPDLGLGSELGGPLDDIFGGQTITKFNLNSGFQLSRNRWSLTANGTYIQTYGSARDTYNIIGGINYALSPTMTFGIFGRHIRTVLDDETGLNLQFIWRPARNKDVRLRYDTLRNEAQAEYSRSATPVVGSLNYSLGALSNFDTDSHSFNGDAFYIGNRFEAFARHDVFTGTGDNDSTRQISRATIRSSLAYADGAIALGRPIGDSFAIVTQHDSLRGKKVTIDPNEAGHSSSTGILGPALAAEINTFAERSVFFDVEDLPVGYDLGEGQFNVKPPFNGGYKIEIGSGASFTIIGQVVDKVTGERVPFIGGRLESLDKPGSDPILAFTNRNGRLAATGLVPGKYKLILLTEPNYEQIIEIPDDEGSLINIGEIRVMVPE